MDLRVFVLDSPHLDLRQMNRSVSTKSAGYEPVKTKYAPENTLPLFGVLHIVSLERLQSE